MIDMSNSSVPVASRELFSLEGLLTLRTCPTCGNRNFSCRRPKAIYDTPISQLRCGYTIPAEERPTIVKNVQRFRSDIETLNREVAELHKRIKRIEAQCSDIELAISYQTGLLSPIRSLPEEILVEILTYSTQGRVDVCSPRSEIWRLEKVCKRWRDVIRSTPTMWTSIDVYLGNLTSYRAGVPLSTVEHLVERSLEFSRDSSLSIRFVEIGLPEDFKRVFGLLSESSHRWKDMSFSLSMLSDAPTLEYGLPRLRTLGLSGSYKGVEPFNSFQHAQQLLELRLFSLPRPFHTLIIPWHQLRYFQAVYCDFQTGEFMDMLQHISRLVGFCSKWSKGLLKNRSKPINPVTLRFLRSIELEASPAEICAVLNPLSVPVLNELYLVTHQFTKGPGFFENLAGSVVAMIQRSRPCHITTLSLSSVDAASVSRILEETPAVTHLILIYISDVEAILHELSTSEGLAPRMDTFSLTCKGNQAMFSAGPLAGIIRSRSTQRSSISSRSVYPGCLHTLNLTVREGGGVDQFVELLEPLSRDHGVSITIHSLV